MSDKWILKVCSSVIIDIYNFGWEITKNTIMTLNIRAFLSTSFTCHITIWGKTQSILLRFWTHSVLIRALFILLMITWRFQCEFILLLQEQKLIILFIFGWRCWFRLFSTRFKLLIYLIVIAFKIINLVIESILNLYLLVIRITACVSFHLSLLD